MALQLPHPTVTSTGDVNPLRYIPVLSLGVVGQADYTSLPAARAREYEAFAKFYTTGTQCLIRLLFYKVSLDLFLNIKSGGQDLTHDYWHFTVEVPITYEAEIETAPLYLFALNAPEIEPLAFYVRIPALRPHHCKAWCSVKPYLWVLQISSGQPSSHFIPSPASQ